MSELISGDEAKLAWANGKSVQFQHDDYPSGWIDLKDNDEGFSISYFNEAVFRLKPRTANLNGVEVPACGTDYKPHTFMFVLNSLETCEYSKIILDESDEIPPYWWKTEEEIIQVVAALRSIFNPQ